MSKKLYGPDVHSGEGKDILKKIEYDFAIVKVCGNPKNKKYRWDYVNPHAKTQAADCVKRSGLLGLYHFTWGKPDPHTEADFFIKQVKELGYIGKAMLIIDYEGPALKMGRKWIKKFADRVKEKAGYAPVIYVQGSAIKEQNLGSLGYPIWEASYPTEKTIHGYKPPEGKVWYKDRTMWQFTEYGRLDGYDGDLDLNVFYGTADDWRKLAGMEKEAHMISNCGHDERNKYSGGAAGDQTGGEYALISWYNRPWNVVLRPATAEIGARLAKIARQAAINNAVGYDQRQRQTYYDELKRAGWHPELITKKCEADCSSSTAANVIATGYQLGVKALKEVKPDSWTGNLRARLKEAGFKVLISDKYTKSSDYLLPGDVLLNEAHHVAINLSKGAKASGEKYGDEKAGLLEVDGWFGQDTVTATQRYFGTVTDGIVSNQAESDKKYLPRAVSGVWQFKKKDYTGGSSMIKALQKMVGMKEKERDGLCGKKTVKALQKYLEVKVTGKLDEATVKEWQKYLNAYR